MTATIDVQDAVGLLPRLEMPAPQTELLKGGYYLLAAYSSTSSFLAQYNFRALQKQLGEGNPNVKTVYIHSDGEDVIELLLVRQNAPNSLLKRAARYYSILQTQCVIDYDDYRSELLAELAVTWKRWAYAKRIRVLATNGLSLDLSMSQEPPKELIPIFEKQANRCHGTMILD